MTEKQTIPADIASMSFEQAMAELESLVRRLEDGSVSLDQAISAYERGNLLKLHCQKKLEDAKLRVEKIALNSDGTFQTEETNIAA